MWQKNVNVYFWLCVGPVHVFEMSIIFTFKCFTESNEIKSKLFTVDLR